MRAFAAFPRVLFEEGRIRASRKHARFSSSTRARRVPHRRAQHRAPPGHPNPGRGPRRCAASHRAPQSRCGRGPCAEISVVQRHSGVPPRLSLEMEEPTRRISPWKQGDDGCRGARHVRQVGGAPVAGSDDDRSPAPTHQSPTSARSCTGSSPTAGRRSGYDAGCAQPSHRDAGPADRSWPGCAPSHQNSCLQPAADPCHDGSGRAARSHRLGERPATFAAKWEFTRDALFEAARQELQAKPDGADAQHQMPASAG